MSSSKSLEKYTKPINRSHRSHGSKMTIVDNDLASAFSKDEIASFQGRTSVVGYGERKLGKWDDDDDDEIAKPAAETKESIKEQFDPEQIASDNESSDEAQSTINAGESKWLEFQRQLAISSKKLDNQDAKKEYFLEDPLMMIRRKKLRESNQPQINYGPPNRFGIKPGLWWDGIDRSNGYEKRRFKMINQAEAKKQQNYKASVADM